MNITVKDLLKHSLVITIDDKRLEWFKKVFKFHGISPMPKRFQGTTLWYNSGRYNCYLSHKNAILAAKKKRWPYVCIFEDDAYPVKNIESLVDGYLKELPNECQVLSLGTIMLWDVRGEHKDFYRSFKSYGSQAYVVFKDAYDKFIEMLDKAPEGDGAFYSRMDDILPKDVFFMPKRNMFIQYNKSDGINNNSGYVYLDTSRLYPKDGKMIIPSDKTIPVERAIGMGFPPVEEIEGKVFPSPNIKGRNDPMVFVTVNAGTSTFTNITIKTILRFHRNAKVFVFDVPRKPEDAFTFIDDDIKDSTEVVKGVLWDELNLPTIKIDEAVGMTEDEKTRIRNRFHGAEEIEVLPNGDYQHPMNIQFALDTLDENFILIDSDAPLVCPVYTIHDSNVVTSAQVEEWNYVHLDKLRPLLHPERNRRRFCPYIQFLNTKMMKEHGVRYFDKSQLKDNLDMTGWFKNPGYNGKESLFFWTGSLFYRNVTSQNLPAKIIRHHWYVDHFGGATWQDKGDRHKAFIEKYTYLFANKDAMLGKFV